jgi:integrase
MAGNITRRGKASWRIKFDTGHDAVTGRRKYHLETVHGSKADAVTLLGKRIAERGEGQLVHRTSITVADYAKHWLSAIAPAKASGKTLERYGELISKHTLPHIGTVELQKLDGPRIDALYAHLGKAGRLDGKGGLSPQTIRHVHRVLALICGSAVKAGKLRVSPMTAVQTAPKVRQPDIQVLDDAELAALLRHLEGRPLYMPVLLAASTGMRRSEVLALQWSSINLDKATLQVAQVVELVGGKMSLKEPKTERSRRTIALPARLVQELKAHRKAQAEYCLKLGCGRFELVFPHWDGTLRNPNNFSKQFADEASAAKLPHITFHGLRHTHITHLLRSGVPVHVVSARAGHSNPTVTLNTYAHLLPGQQEAAAAITDAALRTALTTERI